LDGKTLNSGARIPNVSVIIPCYNAETYIGRSIDTACAQVGDDIDVEILVVDDASTDGSAAFVDSVCKTNERVRLIRCATNGGPGRARNIGIAEARGEWIAILDSDDWYAPGRLKYLTTAAAEGGADLIADNQYFVSEKSERPWLLLRNQTNGPANRISCDDLLRGDTLTKMRNLGLLKPVIRRQFLIEHNLRYDEEKGIAEDFYFLFKCLLRSPYLLMTSKPLYYYRTRSNSLSSTLSSDQILALRTFHERCEVQSRDLMAASTRDLLRDRGRVIDTYTRYKLVVAMIEAGDIKSSVSRIIADPRISFLLVRALLSRLLKSFVASVSNQIPSVRDKQF